LRDLRVYLYKPLSKQHKDPIIRAQYKVVQQALKVFINASYGVFGAETFSLYCPPMAECTTALGRHAIASTIKKAIEMNLPVLYGDTDSLFLWNPPKSKVQELMNWVLRNLGIDLDIDKEYKWAAFSERKKNYLGVFRDGKVDIKGLVGKKKNTPEFIKKLFYEILSDLSKADNIDQLEKTIDVIKEKTRESYLNLKKRRYPLDALAFKVTLSKDLKSYTKTTPQHVKAAIQLVKRGKIIGVGDTIMFVKTKDSEGVKPLQLARIDEIDTDKYLEYIQTTLEQILAPLGITFESIKKTKLLGEYM